jgi:cell division protein FtsI/penicillin-binding protein 2
MGLRVLGWLLAGTMGLALPLGAGGVGPLPVDVFTTLPPGARIEPLPLDGLEVEYTVDPELDAAIARILARGRVLLAHVVLLDPKDGRVLAYVSTDPTAFPATGIYPTASLMKVVTAAAVLEMAPEATQQGCRYVGSPYVVREINLSPPRVGGRVESFWRSLAISNNQCFARLAIDAVGKEALLAQMKRVGIPDVPAPGHSAGRIQPVETPLELGHLGSGLAGSFISPLAAARLASLLVEGQLVYPWWVERVTNGNGETVALPRPRPPRQTWKPELADELRELLVGVTARGTAKSAFRDHRGRPMLGSMLVAGKTGSLSGSDPKGRYEWFIGVAPADAPRVAIATVVVQSRIWWSSAAQISARVLQHLFCNRGRCE